MFNTLVTQWSHFYSIAYMSQRLWLNPTRCIPKYGISVGLINLRSTICSVYSVTVQELMPPCKWKNLKLSVMKLFFTNLIFLMSHRIIVDTFPRFLYSVDRLVSIHTFLFAQAFSGHQPEIHNLKCRIRTVI